MTATARERNVAELAAALRGRLVERRRAEAAAGKERDSDLREAVRALVDEEATLLAVADREEIAARIVRDSVGLGPLEVLLADPAVEEVMVNGADRVYVERGGRIEVTDVAFADEDELRNAIERILAPLGRRVDGLARWSTPGSPTAPGQRRDPAAGDRRTGALDPALRRPPARARRAGRAGESSGRAAPASGDGGRGAPQHPRHRRHRFRQDDPVGGVLQLSPPRTCRLHRGRRRAQPRPSAGHPAGAGPRTSRAPARSPPRNSFARRSACGPTASSSARSVAPKSASC